MRIIGWLLAAAGLWANSLTERVAAAAASAPPAIRRGHWGAHFVQLTSNQTVYAHNSEHHFIPASNTKLFSTSLALIRLGPEHRFVTRLVADGPIRDGTLEGDLRLVGGGDPTLSGRPLPYRKAAPFSNPLGPLETLAGQVAQAGITRITGDIIGDDRHYVWEPYPDGWSVDDTLYEYGAPVSAIILHDNYMRLQLAAGENPGDPVRLRLFPALPYFTADARVRTSSGDQRLNLDRGPGTRQFLISGTMKPNSAASMDVAVDDPARYAAFALRELLVRNGVQVNGGTGVRHRHAGEPAPPAEPEEAVLARRMSPPLIEILKVVNKVSQNLQAEIVLRETAQARDREPSRRGGLEELKYFLTEIGVPRDDYRFEDGSGLSRLTLVAPGTVTSLLRVMHRSRYREQWMDLLPVGGEDGSLSARFRDLRQGRVLAKTGTISHAGALAGYAETARGEWLAFSIMVNNANSPASEIRRFIDRIVMTVVE